MASPYTPKEQEIVRRLLQKFVRLKYGGGGEPVNPDNSDIEALTILLFKEFQQRYTSVETAADKIGRLYRIWRY